MCSHNTFDWFTLLNTAHITDDRKTLFQKLFFFFLTRVTSTWIYVQKTKHPFIAPSHSFTCTKCENKMAKYITINITEGNMIVCFHYIKMDLTSSKQT